MFEARRRRDALQRLAEQRDRIVALLRGTPPRVCCPIQYRSSYAAQLWAWANEDAPSSPSASLRLVEPTHD